MQGVSTLSLTAVRDGQMQQEHSSDGGGTDSKAGKYTPFAAEDDDTDLITDGTRYTKGGAPPPGIAQLPMSAVRDGQLSLMACDFWMNDVHTVSVLVVYS